MNSFFSRGTKLKKIKREFAESFEKIKRLNLSATDAPISVQEAVDLKRSGKNIESSRFYANYVLENKILNPDLVLAWFKTLARAGDLQDALSIAQYMKSRYTSSIRRNSILWFRADALKGHKERLLGLINQQDFSALESYLSSISGNPNFKISKEEIDIFSSKTTSDASAKNNCGDITFSKQTIKAYHTIHVLVDSMVDFSCGIYGLPNEELVKRKFADHMRINCILQAILLHVALFDKEFSKQKQQFIEKIISVEGFNDNSLLKLMKIESNGKLDYDMQGISMLSMQERRSFLDTVDSWILSNVTPLFIPACVVFDSALAEENGSDFCKWICTCIKEIALPLIDEPASQNKLALYDSSVNQLLLRPWMTERIKLQLKL